MIPYYKILDNPEEHSFFLKDLSPQEYHYVSGVTLPDSFYLKTLRFLKWILGAKFLFGLHKKLQVQTEK